MIATEMRQTYPFPPRVAGVILAGGRAMRMGGGDKCLADLGGRPILDHVIDRLRPQVPALAVSANGDPARFRFLGLPILADSTEGFQGPLAGVLAGLDWAEGEGWSAIVTVAGDTPVFPRDLVLGLSAAAVAAETAIALAWSVGEDGVAVAHPTFGLWPVEQRKTLRAALAGGQRRVREWAETVGTARAVFHGRGPRLFFNVNTPNDLAVARASLP